jgi:hypothetical protein
MASRNVLPSDDSSVFDVLDALTSLNKQAIIRSSNPPPGIAGFIFDIPEDDEVKAQAEITDHFLEANITVQDQIALKPIEYTVKGLVAEVAAITPRPETVAKVPDTLPENPFMLPDLTAYQLQEFDLGVDADAITAGDAQDLWQLFNNRSPQPPSQTKQARTFLYFLEVFHARELFTVETPWGTLDNMAILFMSANQNDETKFASSFTITFKQIRIVGSATVNVGLLAGRAANQMAKTTNNGNAGKADVPEEKKQSLLYRWTLGSP